MVLGVFSVIRLCWREFRVSGSLPGSLGLEVLDYNIRNESHINFKKDCEIRIRPRVVLVQLEDVYRKPQALLGLRTVEVKLTYSV